MAERKKKQSVILRVGLTPAELRKVQNISASTGISQARWLADAVRQRLEREETAA